MYPGSDTFLVGVGNVMTAYVAGVATEKAAIGESAQNFLRWALDQL